MTQWCQVIQIPANSHCSQLFYCSCLFAFHKLYHLAVDGCGGGCRGNCCLWILSDRSSWRLTCALTNCSGEPVDEGKPGLIVKLAYHTNYAKASFSTTISFVLHYCSLPLDQRHYLAWSGQHTTWVNRPCSRNLNYCSPDAACQQMGFEWVSHATAYSSWSNL